MTLPELFRKYHRPLFLKDDPLVVVRQFKGADNLETAGLIAATLSYGRVEQINKSITTIFKITGETPAIFIRETSFKEKKKAFAKFKHRFNDGDDVALMLETLGRLRQEHGTLEGFFLKAYDETQPNIRPALQAFSEGVRMTARKIGGHGKRTFDFLFPSPLSGSACKRLNMYLRWMVRKDDGVDLGVWKGVSTSKLVVPVDTHVAACGRKLKLTHRKNADWKMAEEITESLKKYDPNDPVKFDFAICSAGKMAFRGR